ncbi:MAG: PQQ-binding-like beta-propeller repeat protein [Verrucomicrobiaceae bacterium]|nr:PQQ-binding-like beta-propeller repeat protein [Verrucomicrobiaceae bacterium]
MRTLCVIPFVLLVAAAHAGNWPAWRGPNRDGTCDETGLPTKWSATDNVLWKVALPGPGNSTPVIWEDKIFVTQATNQGKRRELICFDKKSGSELWKQGTDYRDDEPTHGTNPHCAASPAVDGKRVIVSFASAGVFAYDLGGKKLWSKDLGPQKHIWGNGASPVLVGNTVYLNHGPSNDNTKLVALDVDTGEVKWSNSEPKRPTKGSPDFYGSWSDPLPLVIDGKSQLFMSWPFRVCAINPEDGRELWTCEGLNALVYTSPIYSEGIVVGMGGYSGMALGVRTGGKGDVTNSHRLWHTPKNPQRIASGVIHEGHVYIHNDPGIVQCIELNTGKQVWSERLKGQGASGQNWSSVVLSEGKCYTANQGGDCFVFKASPKFELLATNPLGEKVIASIAVSDQKLFIRGHRHLFCIGR